MIFADEETFNVKDPFFNTICSQHSCVCVCVFVVSCEKMIYVILTNDYANLT